MDSHHLGRATTITDEEVKDIFDYHKPDEGQVERMRLVREATAAAFKVIVEHCPPSADRSPALRKLREVRMDANSAIVHGGKF